MADRVACARAHVLSYSPRGGLSRSWTVDPDPVCRSVPERVLGRGIVLGALAPARLYLFAQIGNLRKQISDRAEVRDGLVSLKGAARGTFAGP